MKLNNKYYIMRHGQAISNVKAMCSCWPEKFHNPLTRLGRQNVKESLESFKVSGKVADIIFTSPLLRAKQTAEIAGKFLKVKVKIDKRLREMGFGVFNGKKLESMWKSFKGEDERIERGPAKGESYSEISNRMEDFLKDVDKKYSGKNILFVSHEGPLMLLQGRVMELSVDGTIKEFPFEKRIHKAEIRELN